MFLLSTSKIDHVFEHKASFNRYKKTEITSCIVSDHHGLKLGINNNGNSREFTNSWKLNNSLPNEKWAKTENKNILYLNENENTTYPNNDIMKEFFFFFSP